ncbi:conserved hypothetical protein [metagenome]|uniref:Htaa domain-containing protein n=1 Tax=metagenome TaxID=256318 RepID=A0A2P2C0P0_9ZZZZ
MMGLTWTVKASFRAYVERLADGSVVVSDGAQVAVDGGWTFGADPTVSAPVGVDGFLAFHGEVRFQAHGGLLVVRILDPWLTVVGERGELTISTGSGRAALVSLDIAQVDSPAGTATWAATDVRLTPDGVELFNGVYQAGEPFEPFTITLPLAPH